MTGKSHTCIPVTWSVTVMRDGAQHSTHSLVHIMLLSPSGTKIKQPMH